MHALRMYSKETKKEKVTVQPLYLPVAMCILTTNSVVSYKIPCHFLCTYLLMKENNGFSCSIQSAWKIAITINEITVYANRKRWDHTHTRCPYDEILIRSKFFSSKFLVELNVASRDATFRFFLNFQPLKK